MKDSSISTPQPRALYRAATSLALVYVLVWVVTSIAASILDRDIILFLVNLPGIIWMALPVIFAAGLVCASTTRVGAAAYLLLEAALVASTVWLLWYYRGQGAIIGLPLWPIVQFGAITLVFVVTLACGWRMRPDFLLDKTPRRG